MAYRMLQLPSALGDVPPSTLRAIFNPEKVPNQTANTDKAQSPIEALKDDDAGDESYNTYADADVYARLALSCMIPALVDLLEPLSSDALNLADAGVRKGMTRQCRINLLAKLREDKPHVIAPYQVCSLLFKTLQEMARAKNAARADANYSAFDTDFEEYFDAAYSTDANLWSNFVTVKSSLIKVEDTTDTVDVALELLDALYKIPSPGTDVDGERDWTDARDAVVAGVGRESNTESVVSVSTTSASPAYKAREYGEAIDILVAIGYGADTNRTTAMAVPSTATIDAAGVGERSLVGESVHLNGFFGGFTKNVESSLQRLRAYRQATMRRLNDARDEKDAGRRGSEIDAYKVVFDALMASNLWEGVGSVRLSGRVQQYEWLKNLSDDLAANHSGQSPFDPLVPDVVQQTLRTPRYWDTPTDDIARFCPVMPTLEPETVRSAVYDDAVQRWRGSAYAMLINYVCAVRGVVVVVRLLRILKDRTLEARTTVLTTLVDEVMKKLRESRDALWATLLRPTGDSAWAPNENTQQQGVQGAATVDMLGTSLLAANSPTTVNTPRTAPMCYSGPATAFDVRLFNAWYIQLERDVLLKFSNARVTHKNDKRVMERLQSFLVYAAHTTRLAETLDIIDSNRSLARHMLEREYYPLAHDTAALTQRVYLDWLGQTGINRTLAENVNAFYRALEGVKNAQWYESHGDWRLRSCASETQLATALSDAASVLTGNSLLLELRQDNAKHSATAALFYQAVYNDGSNYPGVDLTNETELLPGLVPMLLATPRLVHSTFERIAAVRPGISAADVWAHASMRTGLNNATMHSMLTRRHPTEPPALFQRGGALAAYVPDDGVYLFWRQFAKTFLGRMAAQRMLVSSSEQLMSVGPDPTASADLLSLSPMLFSDTEDTLERLVTSLRTMHWGATIQQSATGAEDAAGNQFCTAEGRPLSPHGKQSVLESVQKATRFRALVPLQDLRASSSTYGKQRVALCQWYVQDVPVLTPERMLITTYVTYVTSSIEVMFNAFSATPVSPRGSVSQRMPNPDTSGLLRVRAEISMLELPTDNDAGVRAALSPRAAIDAQLRPAVGVKPFTLHYSTRIPVRQTLVVRR